MKSKTSPKKKRDAREDIIEEKVSHKKRVAVGKLIHVFVNNRLGARYEITCSSSDNIGAFKQLVAAYTGTKADATMLKRQGQRPLKVSIKLGAFEIGDGSSFDFETDTRN